MAFDVMIEIIFVNIILGVRFGFEKKNVYMSDGTTSADLLSLVFKISDTKLYNNKIYGCFIFIFYYYHSL